MHPRMKSAPATVLGYVVLVIVLTAGGAQSLSGVNTVFSDDIVNGTIRHVDIKENTIGSSRMLDNSVHSVKISDGSIIAADMADGAVTGAKIADETIASVDLSDNAITTDQIAADAVTGQDIATGAVTSVEVAARTLDASDMNFDELTADEISANAIEAPEIAGNAVGSSEIATGAVQSAEIADDTVGSAEIDDRGLTLDDFATAEDSAISTNIAINANDCVTIATGLAGASVGDLAIVVLRSATDGTFWEGQRVTTPGQFPLRACNTTDVNLASATSTIDVFTVRP